MTSDSLVLQKLDDFGPKLLLVHIDWWHMEPLNTCKLRINSVITQVWWAKCFLHGFKMLTRPSLNVSCHFLVFLFFITHKNFILWRPCILFQYGKLSCVNFFGGHKSFSWSHWYPCFGRLPWVSKPGWIPCVWSSDGKTSSHLYLMTACPP